MLRRPLALRTRESASTFERREVPAEGDPAPTRWTRGRVTGGEGAAVGETAGADAWGGRSPASCRVAWGSMNRRWPSWSWCLLRARPPGTRAGGWRRCRRLRGGPKCYPGARTEVLPRCRVAQRRVVVPPESFEGQLEAIVLGGEDVWGAMAFDSGDRRPQPVRRPGPRRAGCPGRVGVVAVGAWVLAAALA